MIDLDINEFSATGKLALTGKKEIIISDIKDRIALMEAYSRMKTIIQKYE